MKGGWVQELTWSEPTDNSTNEHEKNITTKGEQSYVLAEDEYGSDLALHRFSSSQATQCRDVSQKKKSATKR